MSTGGWNSLKTAHTEIVAGVLRTPLESLAADLEESSRATGVAASAFVDGMREHLDELLPGDDPESPAATHLSSVLLALSRLEKNRGRATRSIS